MREVVPRPARIKLSRKAIGAHAVGDQQLPRRSAVAMTSLPPRNRGTQVDHLALARNPGRAVAAAGSRPNRVSACVPKAKSIRRPQGFSRHT